MGYSQDNLFYLAYWYPAFAVSDDVEGWVTEPFLGQTEFYAGFADYDLTVEAPAGWLIAATGVLQNPETVLAPDVLERRRQAYESDSTLQIATPETVVTTGAPGVDRLQWRFRADRVRDVVFSATRASYWDAARAPIGDRDGDGAVDYTHLNTIYRELAPRWKQVTRYQQHAITFLSDYFALPYPWPHMTAVEGSGIIGGGMEYPMMTLMGDYNTSGDRALYYVTAHELVHMWIPMIVGTNERRYSWFDEGMTTFTENQARMDRYPGANHNLSDQALYVSVARAGLEGEILRHSNYHASSLAYSVASYSKPATLLVALRELLGEETFQRGLRAFVRDWAYKHPYPYDLFNTFERVSGRDLDWFWTSWYDQTWTLDQAVADVRPDTAGTTVVVRDLGWAPMPVLLVLTLADGRTVRHTVPVDAWLEGATETTVTIPTDAAVERVEIDPDLRFPDIDRANNVWPRESPGRESPD